MSSSLKKKDTGVAKAALAARRRRAAAASERPVLEASHSATEEAESVLADFRRRRQQQEQGSSVASSSSNIVPPLSTVGSTGSLGSGVRKSAPTTSENPPQSTTTTTDQPTDPRRITPTPAAVPSQQTTRSKTNEKHPPKSARPIPNRPPDELRPTASSERRGDEASENKNSDTNNTNGDDDDDMDALCLTLSAARNITEVRLVCHTEAPWHIGMASDDKNDNSNQHKNMDDDNDQKSATGSTTSPIHYFAEPQRTGDTRHPSPTLLLERTTPDPDDIADTDPFVRYGCDLRLGAVHCTTRRRRYLGLVTTAKTTATPKNRRVAWLLEHDPAAWRLEPAVLGKTVPVGWGGSAEEDKQTYHNVPQRMVRSGDPLLVRHAETNGILCVTPQGTLELRTDGFPNPTRAALVDTDPHELTISPQVIFHFLLAAAPPVPLWSFEYERKYLTGRNLDANRHQVTNLEKKLFRNNSNAPTVGALVDHTGSREKERQQQLGTSVGQELVLLDELLGAFFGLSSENNLFVQRDGLTFRLRENPVRLDTNSRRLAQELVPLATAYVQVHEFVATRIARYEHGLVMHACCAEIDAMLQEYLGFLHTVDQTFRDGAATLTSLHDLQLLLRPALHTMTILEQIINSIRPFKGGALINALRSVVGQLLGDATARTVLDRLLDASSKPFMRMLQQWLDAGELQDPHGEFMVARSINAKEDWTLQYSVVPEHVLDGIFVTEQTVDRVVAAGKYWSAIRTASPEQQRVQDSVTFKYSDGMVKISSYVSSRFHSASRILVRLLLDDCDLLGALCLLKRYFLMEHGDFFVHFLDAAEQELRKELPRVSLGQVQHWLKMSVHLTESGTTLGGGKARLGSNQLRCAFANESLIDQLDRLHAAAGGLDTHEPNTPQRHMYGRLQENPLNGLQAFLLHVHEIPFPLSLVLTDDALKNYQILFRLMFLAKHAERRLVGIWQDHQTMKEMPFLRKLMGKTFLLRQKMLHFVQNLIYHIFEVVEPNWHEMMHSISLAKSNQDMTVDDILKLHADFIQKTVRDCLLTDRTSIRSLTKLLTVCNHFCDQMAHFRDATRIDCDREIIATSKQNAMHQSMNNRGVLGANLSHKQLHAVMQATRKERMVAVHQQGLRVKREVDNESYKTMVSRFENVLNEHLSSFLETLSPKVNLHNRSSVALMVRLQPVANPPNDASRSCSE